MNVEKVEGPFYLLNDDIIKNEDDRKHPEFEGRTVYEFIRVQDGIAIFLEDHLERFFRSAAYLDLPLPATAVSIEDRVYRLIAANQVEEQNPPPNPAKVTDSRYESYRAQYGEESWELDALSPQYLHRLVSKEVESLVEFSLWNERCKEVEEVRGRLQKLADEFDKGEG